MRPRQQSWMHRPLLSSGLGAALLVVAAISTPLLSSHQAEGAVVERIVAIVGEHAILLSDLRARAKPFLLRVHREVPAGAQRNAAISQMYSLVLDRMVDEQLQQRAANRAKITVSAAEIEQGIARVAAQNGLTVEQVIAEATRSGMTERGYRNEIRRQVLDAKMLNLRLMGRIRVTVEDMRSLYQRYVIEERQQLRFRAAWITFDSPQKARKSRARRIAKLAEQVAAKAQAGADFATLVRRYSDDASTRGRGGLLEPSPQRPLPPAVGKAVLALEPGEISAPIRTGSQLVILKLIEREQSSLPSFEESVEELQQRVYLEKMNKARRHWLDGLRRRSHVEIRL